MKTSKYLKLKYVFLLIEYIIVVLSNLKFTFARFLLILLVIPLVISYMMRIKWIKENKEMLKPYKSLLILEDIFLNVGLIFIIFTYNIFNKDYVNIFYCISLIVFFIPTIILIDQLSSKKWSKLYKKFTFLK